MTTSFYNGISGLMSFQKGIDIWGDNIANVNTTAFKESIPEFATIFSETLNMSTAPTSNVGLGSYLDSSAKDMSIGALQQTDNPFDMAIGGNGWFGVKNGNQIYYTRDGAFKRDAKGFLVNDNGEYLLVANANNLIQKDGKYYIDTKIDTTKLLPSTDFSPISLPNDIILPAVATKNVSLKTNLNNDTKIYSTKPAPTDIDFSALYDKDGYDIQMQNGEDFVYGFGNKVTYNNGILSSNFCFSDDKVDGNDVNIDFTLNSKEINLTLPDGSTKEEIAQAVANALKQQGFDANAKNGELTINTQNTFILKSNTSIIPNTAAAVLTYTPQKESDYQFSNLEDLGNEIENLANQIYPNAISLSFENGQIILSNNTDNTINAYINTTKNSNQEFINNLGKLNSPIYPHSTSSSDTFNVNSQDFGGNIIDEEGNKLPFTITFTKSNVSSQQTTWKGDIVIKTPNGDLKTSQDFIFSSDGKLISPTQISFDNINFNFDLTSYISTDTNAINYSLTQDGIEKGYLKNYQIDNEGRIIAIFSNDHQAVLGQIPIFHFKNDQGLANIGNNDYINTIDSGEATLYTDNGNYIPTKILSSTLEMSNVNLTQAMTELIVTQKAFQASAKTVTTSDQMIQKAIEMKR